jgi:hypothetical protein
VHSGSITMPSSTDRAEAHQQTPRRLELKPALRVPITAARIPDNAHVFPWSIHLLQSEACDST